MSVPLILDQKIDGSLGFDVGETAGLLRRYQSVHRGLMRATAGWMIAMPRYEDKYALTYHLWDHAQHAMNLRQRLRELRGGHPDANIEPALVRTLEEIAHASNPCEFVAGAYLELGRRLLDAYRWHQRSADPAANAPEIQLCERIIPNLEAHLGWASDFLSKRGSSQWIPWKKYVADLLDRVGGASGREAHNEASKRSLPHPSRFERPRTVVVDERLKRGGLLSLAERRKLPYAEERIEQFKVYFNEIYAASMLASILYDAGNSEVPFEFLYDVAHQCWDETRHSQFGATRLRELGQEPQHFDPVVYEQTESLPILHRFCHLTLNLEVYFMARKRPRVTQYEEHGDARSKLFADIDWSDEINHVRYGKKWIDYFLKDDCREPDDLKSEIAEHLARVQAGSDGPRGIEPPF